MNGTVSDRRTKILCTLGPSSSDIATIKEMMKAGMNAARLNFSHGDHEMHGKTIETIRRAASELNIPFAIVQDLQGPKIRIGKLAKPFIIEEGEELIITTDKNVIPTGEDHEPRPRKVSTSYPLLAKDCRVGSHLMIDDGYLEVVVIEKNSEETELKCKVITGGLLNQKKGINLAAASSEEEGEEASSISAPALTEKDIADLEFGMKCGEIDYVCLSFVRSAQDIIDARQLMMKFSNHSKTVPIIAKIERIEAIRNIESIIKECDGIMVARGDLMIETRFDELPILQKDLIERSSKAGKVDITATQMLQSMVDNKIPTRAEVTDVANSIFDGTDVTMLSNETATGKHPVLAVKTMSTIVRTADLNCDRFGRLSAHENEFDSLAVDSIDIATCMAAAAIAKKHTSLKLVCCITHSGRSAFNISQFRVSVPIIALTDQNGTYNRLSLGWGITPVLIKKPISEYLSSEELCAQYLKENGFAQSGDLIVMVLGAETINHQAHTVRLVKLP
ncbi:hypothetical protein C9374_014441 [Naegleria lovaniensis]|uniref:Pyruvate kinase n=1 Tax=Naegleria lovaniensis TaxID=51637 RepID=A0AA88GVA2_NAELO|nr:uncharacterized protein C9374_014441 [Naegleria lovaniensis]KAG2389041.1 hypothetical protein C9374_014441 [Naegleria lovaniensis]